MRSLVNLIFFLSLSIGCAGIPLPFTDARLGHWPLESDRQEVNSRCIAFQELSLLASALETQHLAYIRTEDENLAIRAAVLLESLGPKCQGRFIKLSTPEIKQELFGDIQIVNDATRLRELGGVAFEYQDVSTKTEFELSLHQGDSSQGPRRRLVAVYRLEDDLVIHYNYSGTDNVDTKNRSWPITTFFGLAIKAATSVAIP